MSGKHHERDVQPAKAEKVETKDVPAVETKAAVVLTPVAPDPTAASIAEAQAVRQRFPAAVQPDPVRVRDRIRLREVLAGRTLDSLGDDQLADAAATLHAQAITHAREHGSALAIRAQLEALLAGLPAPVTE